MNERIQELMIQSNPEGDFSGAEWVLEKFALLIVGECDAIMAKYEQANMESDIWVEMMGQMRTELREQFVV